MSRFTWVPTSDYVERANVTRLMRTHGIENYWDLVRRSQEDIEWFWNAVVEDLGVAFSIPYAAVLDDSAGPAWPRWFLGGRINLASNCIDRHLAERAASIAIAWRERMARSAGSTTGSWRAK